MAKRVITQAELLALKPTAARQEIADGKISRFYHIIQPLPSGARSGAIRYDIDKVSKKYTLEKYWPDKLRESRKEAALANALIDTGRDLAAEKKAERTAKLTKVVVDKEPIDLVKSAAERFILAYPAYGKRRSKSLRTTREVERLLRHDVLPRWGQFRLSEISKAEKQLLLDDISATKPILANRIVGVLRLFGRWCEERDLTETNIFGKLQKPSEEVPRERALDENELRALLEALDGEASATDATGYPYRPLILMLLMTGARRSEVSEMRWSELDLDGAAVWRLPASRSKNRHAHERLLPAAIIELLRDLPRHEGSSWVFSTDGAGPVKGFIQIKERLDKRMALAVGAPIAPWTFHDLRRSFATQLGEIGIQPHIIEACLNHRSGVISGISAVYNKATYGPEQLAALRKWSDRLDEIRSGKKKEPAKVFDLADRR